MKWLRYVTLHLLFLSLCISQDYLGSNSVGCCVNTPICRRVLCSNLNSNSASSSSINAYSSKEIQEVQRYPIVPIDKIELFPSGNQNLDKNKKFQNNVERKFDENSANSVVPITFPATNTFSPAYLSGLPASFIVRNDPVPITQLTPQQDPLGDFLRKLTLPLFTAPPVPVQPATAIPIVPVHPLRSPVMMNSVSEPQFISSERSTQSETTSKFENTPQPLNASQTFQNMNSRVPSPGLSSLNMQPLMAPSQISLDMKPLGINLPPPPLFFAQYPCICGSLPMVNAFQHQAELFDQPPKQQEKKQLCNETFTSTTKAPTSPCSGAVDGRNKRAALQLKEVTQEINSSFCSDSQLRKIILNNLNASAVTSKTAIHSELKKEIDKDFIVFCTTSPASFIAESSTYCVEGNNEMTCYVFLVDV